MMSSKTNKKFDFTRFKQRHIALKILYFGWDYSGLAGQGDSDTTIEHFLFKALVKTCLIESREKCHFNRCGRTDKGVSSYGQVLNLFVRSNLIDEANTIGLFSPDAYNPPVVKAGENVRELNYVDMLNHNLPDYIKVIAWAPVKLDFSARFKCQSRSYSYIFPKGDLCIDSMQEGLNHLVGEHDFRNLCSFDLKNGVTNHVRTILSATISPIEKRQGIHEQYEFYNMVIVGQAFLYHQIRCIMTIVFLIGSRKESPSVTKDLLNLEKCHAKPHYSPASSLPLCLFDCKYQKKDLPLGWNYDTLALVNLIKQMKHLWWQYKTKSLMIERVLFDLGILFNQSKNDGIEDTKCDLTRWKDFGLQSDNMSDVRYVDILKRRRDDSLESKLEELERKKLKKSNETVDEVSNS